MNAPVDPEETHGGSEPEDPFGENSQTWGAADPDFDRMLRERLGPLPTMPTPPYAFERVLLAGRRRRTRKVWAAGAVAALVVMAGTAGTTVALHGPSNGVVTPAAGDSRQPTTPLSSPSPSLSASPSASATVTRSPSASATSAAAASTSASVPQCHSDDLQLTVSLTPGGNNLDDLLIVLRNNSAHACTTVGYPGLQTETQSEQLQSTTVTRVGKSQKLTLGPGQYASTLAEFTTVASGATATPTGAGCGAPSYYLAVIPPNEQSQIVAPIQGGPVAVCGKGIMDVSPLTMGNTG
jgi:hypothetical protein